MSGPVNQTSPGKVDGWPRRLARLLLPPRCLLCGESGADGRDLCHACAEALPWSRHACPHCALPLPQSEPVCGECLRHPPALTHAHAACVYGFPFDRLVPRFKFHHDLAAGRLMAELLCESLADVPRPQALIPIPLHASRLRKRGYDQALELAKPVSRELGIPLVADALLRVRPTAPQSELDAEARQRNLRYAFAVRAGFALPAHVALVDDVMTTGATLNAAAKTLLRAGVMRVDAWVCARVP